MKEEETVVYFKIKDWKGVIFPKLGYRLDYNLKDLDKFNYGKYRMERIEHYNSLCKPVNHYHVSALLEQCSLALINMVRIPQIGEKIQLPGTLLFGHVGGLNDRYRLFGYRGIKTIEEFKSNVFPELKGEKPMQYRKRLYDLISYCDQEERCDFLGLGINSRFENLIYAFQSTMNLSFTVVDLSTDISDDFDLDYQNPGELEVTRIIVTLEVLEKD